MSADASRDQPTPGPDHLTRSTCDMTTLLASPRLQWLKERKNWAVPLSVALLCLLAFALRCLRLTSDPFLSTVSVDSHYFHRMAELLVLDETYFYPTHYEVLPIPMLSGMTYPLAALARAIAFVTPMSPLNALEFGTRFLPPALGAVTVLVLYLVVSRLYNRSAAILAALMMAIVPWAVLPQAAGYLDRDPLSILLVMVGVFSFHFLSTAGFRFAWVAAGMATAALEALLYIEWGFVGPVILLAIVAAFWLLEMLIRLIPPVISAFLAEDDVIQMFLVLPKELLKALPVLVRHPATKAIGLVAVLNAAVLAFRPDLLRDIYDTALDAVRGAASGTATVQELAGLSLNEILAYGPMLVPIFIGLYVVVKRRHQSDILLLGWFAAIFFGALFARRLFLYLTPALCIIGGLGLAALLHDIGKVRLYRSILDDAFFNPRAVFPHLRIALAVIVVLGSLLLFVPAARSIGNTPPTSVSADWGDALIWLRDNTDEEAVIMTWWDYGYWILDVAHRTPVVDPGSWHSIRDTDIARVYVGTDDSEAVEIMARYGATYLVFSEVEIAILPSLAERALGEPYGDGTDIPPELRDSLFARSFREDFESEHGLSRAYPDHTATEPAVVVLTLL